MKLYFVRHGESEANLLHEFSYRGLKHGLTDKGEQQAHVLAQLLRHVPVTGIFSSPLLRAIQTAEILAHELGVSYQVADALREFDCGILEGKSDATSWQSYWQLSDAWLRRKEWEKRIDQGESFVDIQQRFIPFIDHLLQVHRTSPSAFVLVGHGGTYRCMLPLVLRNIDFCFAADHGRSPTAAIVAGLTPKGLVCLTWGENVLVTPV
jgi:broad specificity phosphatase PhoE